MGKEKTPAADGEPSKLEQLQAEIDQIDMDLVENKKNVDKDYESFFKISYSKFYDDMFF